MMLRSLTYGTAVVAVFLGTQATAQGRFSGPPTTVPQRTTPVHNAFELLKQTTLADIYLGKPGAFLTWSSHQFCGAGAQVVLVFKVDETYKISDSPEYWSFVDNEVVPAVRDACGPGSLRWVNIGNYVQNYRLTIEPGTDRRVFTLTDHFPRLYGDELLELPLSTATLHEPPVLPRIFSSEEGVWPFRTSGSSISDLIAAQEAHGRAVAETAAENARALNAADHRRAASEADRSRWSYQQGVGFRISSALAEEEAGAANIASAANPLTLLGEMLQISGGTSPSTGVSDPMSQIDALQILGYRNRRISAQAVLGTLRGWTSNRFSHATLRGFSDDSLFNRIFTGRFPTEGRVVPQHQTPDVSLASIAQMLSSGRADQIYYSRLFEAYHDGYSALCRRDNSLPWQTLTYQREVLETRNGFGTVVRRETVVEAAQRDVRGPYAYVLKNFHPNESVGGLLGASDRASHPHATLEKDVETFLRRFGCASDITRQFEVNLYLLQQDFPSAQSLIRGTTASGHR